ncbi:MAG: ParB N-terminal domain-containing protein [Candidatus Kapaibacterium sp.]
MPHILEEGIKKREVSNLIFDPQNPRIPSLRQAQSDIDIIEYMIERENVIDLIASIGEQGYFPGEPLLVVKSEANVDKFEVVEGNRRLAALKLLQDPDIAPTKKNTIHKLVSEANQRPDTVDTLLFPKREDILDYLGYRHITGIDQWDSLQKARFLTQLWERHYSTEIPAKATQQHIARLIGSRADYVEKLINGFQLYSKIEEENFYSIPSLNEETFSFSLLTTAVSYSNIKDFLKIKETETGILFSEETLKELIDWMFRQNSELQTRVPESRSLKVLNAVVSKPEALKKFREGRSLDEAALLTDEPIKNFYNILDQAYRRLQLARESLHMIDNFREEDESLSKDTSRTAKIIYNHVSNTREDQS